MTTLDEVLWKKIEPTTSKPRKRLEAISRLRSCGVRAGVFLSPILPGITDHPAHLECVVEAAAASGADFLWPGVLRLGQGISEYYVPFLEPANFRTWWADTTCSFPASSARGSYTEHVEEQVRRLKAKHGITETRPDAKTPERLARTVQLSRFT